MSGDAESSAPEDPYITRYAACEPCLPLSQTLDVPVSRTKGRAQRTLSLSYTNTREKKIIIQIYSQATNPIIPKTTCQAQPTAPFPLLPPDAKFVPPDNDEDEEAEG